MAEPRPEKKSRRFESQAEPAPRLQPHPAKAPGEAETRPEPPQPGQSAVIPAEVILRLIERLKQM
jgi:hypothetical protein